MNQVKRVTDLILPVGLVTALLIILTPLPAWLIDALLATNIAVSVVILLTTVFVKTPLEFNVFPALLLATTLARLVMNIASTRLILTSADEEGLDAAGEVIRQFGAFVAGDNLVVGIIIFSIIVVIQFVVITKGATRISEVAARFALDGMPGRQMAIDADLNAGAIDEKEAKRRREEITQQADFFGAMDGASKFVRGDAIAGIMITFINLIGGFIIGVAQGGMTLAEAALTYSLLTVGDGLASQVPAFLISLAAGLLTTRSSQSSNLPGQFIQQIFNRPEALIVAAVFLIVLVFTSMPAIPMFSLAGGFIGLALLINRKKKTIDKAAVQQQLAAETQMQKPPEERIEDYLTIDPMELEIGIGLIRLADPKRGGDLLPRITGVRQAVASEIGIVLPKVRIRDNMRLGENSYRLRIANNTVAEGFVYPDRMLAMNSGLTTGRVPGEETRDPAFDQPAVWIEQGVRDRAEMFGYTPIEPAAVVATHLKEIVRRHADELLTRDSTKHLIDELKKNSPAVVDELIPTLMKLSDVQQVLQMLLREEVPVRQLGVILETLGDYAGRTKDSVWLTEYVRHRLARTICSRYRDAENRLHVVTLDPAMEDRIAAGIEHSERGLFIRMSPLAQENTCQSIAQGVKRLVDQSKTPIVLVSPQIRPGLRQITQVSLPRLKVLSYNEITRDTQIESHGLVTEGAPVPIKQ